MSVWDDIRGAFERGNAIVRLIFVNIAVFLAVLLVQLSGILFQFSTPWPVSWLAASSSFTEMLFKPWTAGTYMFLHEGFWHLLWNMVMLWFGGRIFAEFLNDKRAIATYFGGGFAGYLLFLLAYNALPAFNGAAGYPILGASAAVLALLVAIATYLPNYEVMLLFNIRAKLKYIALVVVILDVVAIRDGQNQGGHFAHLGGALYGFLYARSLRAGNDWANGFWAVCDALAAPFRSKQSGNKRMKVVHRSRKASSPTSQTKSNTDQERVDEILDKISRSGYDSLTREERDFLFRVSNKE